jgi:hypothetical protein
VQIQVNSNPELHCAKKLSIASSVASLPKLPIPKLPKIPIFAGRAGIPVPLKQLQELDVQPATSGKVRYYSQNNAIS